MCLESLEEGEGDLEGVFSGGLAEWMRERERPQKRKEREYLDHFFVLGESILVKLGYIFF